MAIAVLPSRSIRGINAFEVSVEVCVGRGLPRMVIVGLAETTVREAEHRVRAAIVSSGYTFPLGRIVINLAPAGVPKETSRFDLAIALGILIVSRQLIPVKKIDTFEFVGELSLTGSLREVPGMLPIAIACASAERTLLCPAHQSIPISKIKGLVFQEVTTLRSAVNLLQGKAKPEQHKKIIHHPKSTHINKSISISQIQGQHVAKRALLLAASGGHNLLMIGSPGTGKTLLANAILSLLPDLTDVEAIESACIYSVSKDINTKKPFKQRPFRAPHHTVGVPAMLGGGSIPRPGEISLAHNGILFLDELSEYKREVLESLREPIESGSITLIRNRHTCSYPSRFLLLGAMNPCPCGFLGETGRECGKCTKQSVRQFQQKLSGPLLDRFDLQVTLHRERIDIFNTSETSSETLAEDIKKVRQLQKKRQNKLNTYLNHKEIQKHCNLSTELKQRYQIVSDALKLSARASVRLLRVARTISDLAGRSDINDSDIMEAATYRSIDRNAM